MPELNIKFELATTGEEFDFAKDLFQQYAKSLSIDLSFQDFTNELKTIDKQYSKPGGALLLAYDNNAAIGCVALRKFDSETAELKRMFIRPEYRKHKIGKKLLELITEIAKELNYKKMRLDTLPDMEQAQRIYKAHGFYEIPPYRFNPVPGTVYMEKEL